MTSTKVLLSMLITFGLCACALDQKMMCQTPGAACSLVESIQESAVFIKGDNANDCLKQADEENVTGEFYCQLPYKSIIYFDAASKLPDQKWVPSER